MMKKSNQNRNYYHDLAIVPVKLQEKNKSKSILRNFRSAVKKIAIVFASFLSKPKREDNPDGDGPFTHRNLGMAETSSSGYSTGSKSRSSIKLTDSFASSNSTNGQFVGSVSFSIEDIQRATRNFDVENIVGEGGFGKVYKGLLSDGSLVAVKRANKNLYDNRSIIEFKSEILAFSKIEHLNLVRFYGYLEHKDERVIVMEYVGNGTLREHLDGKRGNGLELGERLDIATDVAHAITYMHNYNDPPIIHRDIKASNILITEKLRAKVADFGFARLVPDDPDKTHISTQIKGTGGYLDPEYLKTYQLTEKSDVYSFGVLLVELVTGRHPLEPEKGMKERVTTRWAMHHLRLGEPVLAMDPTLRRSPASIAAVENMLKLAKLCLEPIRQSRPSMKKCAEELWVIRKEFRELHSKLNSSPCRKSANLLEKDARKTRQRALGIEEESYTFMSA